MPSPQKPFWFAAKRYGWGWGLPASWQGWAVMAAWFLILIGGALLVAVRSLPAFFLFIAFMTGLLGTIAFVKGDPAGRHWNWGKKPSPEDETLCPQCGYDLRASQDRCPECGTPFVRKTKIVSLK